MVPIPQDIGYYAATSDSSTIQGYAEALGMERVFQTLLFVLFSVIVFLLFRMALSNILSFFAVIMLMTNAQVVLVYLSAPFWDFSTAVIPLVAIIGTTELLSSRHQNFSLTRRTRRNFVVTIICLNLVIVSLYHRVYNLMAQRGISIFACASAVLIVGLIWLRSERNEAKSENRTVLSTSGSDRLFFIPILFTLFLLQPILGRGGKSYATMILVICLFVFVLSENGLRISHKFVIPTLFLLLVQLRSSGDYFQFYLFKGWSNAHQLSVGRDDDQLIYGVPHTDGATWQVSVANTRHGLRSLLQNVSINGPEVVENVKIGFEYLMYGFWKFYEPPLGFENFALLQGRGYIVLSVGVVAPILLFVASFIFMEKALKVAIFSAFIGFLLLLSVGFTLTMMHQWWALQIFGLYGALYGLSWFTKTIASLVFSHYFSTQLKNKANYREQLLFNIKSKISKKSWPKILCLFLIFAVSPRIVFSVLNSASEKLETNRLETLAKIYGQQNWEPVSVINGDMKNIEIRRESDLIKVVVSDNCTLTGVRMHYLNSDALDDLKLERGDYYRTKFHIGNTDSDTVYIPFFPRKVRNPTISVVGLKADCLLRVYQTRIQEQTLPLVALLVPNREARRKEISAEENDTTNSGEEMLLDSFRFEGYIRNNGYQAVGDELSHRWLNYQIGDRILGRSKQGFQEVDIWSQKIDIETDGMRVLIRGKIKRGILIIGWAEISPVARRVIPDNFSYVVRGSTFESTTRSLFECFELPVAKEIQNGLKFELFIGSVFDLYSPRWTSYEIDSIILDRGTCDTNLQPISFLPTL